MTIKWEDPPATARILPGKGKMQLFVAELKLHPGKWAIYRTGMNVHGASSTANIMKRVHDGVEAVSRQGKVYARWVGDEAST